MEYLTKDALLGASDLKTRDVDVLGGQVKVRSLPASAANQAITEAMQISVDAHGEQQGRVDTTKLEALQVLHGLVEPKFDTLEEVLRFQQQVGPAWQTIHGAITDLSGISGEAAQATAVRFPAGGTGAAGTGEVDAAGSGNGGPDLPARAGAGAGDTGR